MSQDVLREPAKAAIFLVVDVRPGSEETARDLLADLAGLTRAVGFRAPDDQLSCVVGIGASMWRRLYQLPLPRDLHPFRGLSGARHTAPATHGDLLFHLRARRLDLCFELERQVMRRLAGHVKVLDEVQGFKYFDERDLLGFVDGTENPDGAAATAAITVGAEDPAYAGGSYVIVQKYLHDLDAWQALPVAEQERVIGRSKLDDIELTEQAVNSH
ncbi:MAG: Dyp-type peroxidase, partial [Kribbellaceae bacterium]|nr:Dyp-type peroxidase [Kribbellaceae bacterium]